MHEAVLVGGGSGCTHQQRDGWNDGGKRCGCRSMPWHGMLDAHGCGDAAWVPLPRSHRRGIMQSVEMATLGLGGRESALASEGNRGAAIKETKRSEEPRRA